MVSPIMYWSYSRLKVDQIESRKEHFWCHSTNTSYIMRAYKNGLGWSILFKKLQKKIIKCSLIYFNNYSKLFKCSIGGYRISIYVQQNYVCSLWLSYNYILIFFRRMNKFIDIEIIMIIQSQCQSDIYDRALAPTYLHYISQPHTA